jgi:polyhydroxybutyrate depolymerase
MACGIFLTSVIGAIVVRDAAMASASTSNKSGSIEIDGRKRTYLVHLPPGYDGRTPLPLVLVLHGATESPEGVERLSRMSIKADEANFIAAYPRGTGRLNPAHFPTWNSGACCGYAMTHHVDDVAFLRALLARLKKDYAVDPKRIYVTGISNGGMMSYRLACELSGEIAAAAPVEGAQDIPCHPSNPVSIIVFHGTADHLVPFNGGSTPFQMGSKRSDTPVEETVAFWVKEDGCSPDPKHSETSEVHTDVYTGCREGTGVALYAIQGGHHMWPGVRVSGNSVPATDLMWAFFAAHPKL